jgi:DNA polymerase-3 subunit epsilon
MLEAGEAEERVWRQLRCAQDEAEAMVAHYAQFERRFFEDAAARLGGEQESQAEERWLCTHRIAKRLLPGVPSLGLRAVAGFFGRPVQESNRAGAHVEATAWIWRQIVRELRMSAGVETVGELEEWMSKEVGDRKGRTYAMARDRRLSLPDEPGVYRLLDGEGGTLYVGKATSLRERVNQYFQTRRGLSARKKELVSQVHDVRCELEATPLEAALSESDVIKEEAAPYNEALVEEGRQTNVVAEWPGTDGEVELVGLDRDDVRITAGQRRAVDDMIALEASLRQGEPTAALIEAVYREEIGPREALSDAFEQFRERFDTSTGVGEAGYGEWMACGARWRSEKRRKEESQSQDDEDPRTYGDEFESLVRHGTAALSRGIWLYRLSGAAVAWRPRRWNRQSGGWRFIGLSEAAVEQRGTYGKKEARRRVETWGGGRQSLETIRLYDRMRVLAAELKRLVGQGASVRLK